MITARLGVRLDLTVPSRTCCVGVLWYRCMAAQVPSAAPSSESAHSADGRCRVVRHQGVEIVLVDVSGANGEQAKVIVQSSVSLIDGRPPRSMRILTDVTQAAYDKEGLAILKDWAQHNTPYVLASAVVGADGLRAAALNAVAFITNRNIRPFATRNEALDWLAAQV